MQEDTPASGYLTAAGPQEAAMAQQKATVAQFVAGPGFKERVSRLQQLPDKQGILISAGKPHHVGNAAIILHALRKQYSCTLPVEIAYRGDTEIDKATRATLSKEFGPLYWLDLEKQPYPAHHFQGYTMDRYEPKIYALYHTRFQKVLLLDADNLALRDPAYLFEAPHAVRHGAMFWLDLWSTQLSSTTFIGHDSVYRLLGINKANYWEVLSAGQGWLHRVSESGQLVLDRVRHADVLEYLWWLTSFSSVLYKHVLGDKDTFGFAFAMAGKLHEVHAVAVPPGAAFKQEDAYWQFQSMLQYDHLGQPAFFHRTFDKWNDVRKPPPLADVVSGPLPNRFVVSHLGNKTVALTPHVALAAFRPFRINCPAPGLKRVVGARHSSSSDHTDGSGYVAAAAAAVEGGLMVGGSCPLSVYLEYQQVRDLGMAVSRQPALEAACADTQQRLHGMTQPPEAAAGSGPRALVQSHRQRLLVRHSSSSGADAAAAGLQGPACSAAANSSVWEQLHASIWLQACSRQRALSSSQQQRQAGQVSEARQQQQQEQEQEYRTSKVGASSAAAAADSASLQASVGLPECSQVEWGVARFVLHEYAEAVARDSRGRVLRDGDPQLPVLQLAQSADTAAAGQPGSDGVRPCGVLEGFVSPLDELQLRTIPAAREWVMEHLAGLPALDKSQH